MTTLPTDFASRQASLSPILGDEGPGSLLSLSNLTNANPFDRLYVDSIGRPTFATPDAGFGASLRGRLMQSAGMTDQLGGVGKVGLRSGMDWIAALALENSYKPKVQLPGGFLDNDEGPLMVGLRTGAKEASKVRLADYWETLDPIQKRMLEQNGYGLQTFQTLGMQTASDFAERWPDIVTALRAHQMVEQTKADNPILSKAAFTTELGMQIVTDPFLWLSFGTSSVAKAGTRKAIQEVVQAGIKGTAAESLETLTKRAARWQTIDEVLGQGPIQFLAGRNLVEGRQLTARALLQGSGVLYGASAGTAMGYAEQTYSLTTGLSDPSQDLQTPYLSAAAGGLLGLGMSEIGLRTMNRSFGMLSNGDYTAYNGIYNLASDVINQQYQRGKVTLDSLMDMEQVSSAEGIEEIMGVLYTRQEVRDLAPLVDAADLTDPARVKTLREYMAQAPTSSELKEYLSRPQAAEPLQRADKNSGFVDPSVDTRGQQRQFHGTQKPIASLADEGYSNPANIYGGFGTFYTTDAYDVSKGYTRKSTSGVVYEVVEKQPVAMYDMEAPLGDDLLASVQRDAVASDALKVFQEQTGRQPNLRELFDEIRTQSKSAGLSQDEVQLVFTDFIDGLKQRGFGGMSHQGGRNTGTSPHTVKIYFNAKDQIELVKTQEITKEIPKSALDRGEVPPTKFSEVRDAMFDLPPRIREAAAAGDNKTAEKLRRELAEYQNEYMRLLSDEFRLNDIGNASKIPGLVEALRSLVNDVPIATLESQNLRSAETARRLITVYQDRQGEDFYTTQVIPWIQNNRVLRKVNTFLNPGQRARVAMTSDDPVTSIIGKSISLVDNSAFHVKERFQNADGSEVADVRTRARTFTIQHLVPLEIVSTRAIKGMDAAQAKSTFKDAVSIAIGKKADGSQQSMDIAKALRSMMDAVGVRGTRAGYLNNILENYLPAYMKPNLSVEQEGIFKTVWTEHSMRRFGPQAGPDAEVHYNTLAKMGYVKKRGKVHVASSKMPEGFSTLLDDNGKMLLPTKVSEISDAHIADYQAALGDAVVAEADWIYRQRAARANDYGMYDPDAEVDVPVYGDSDRAASIRNFVRSDLGRRIEQEILFDERLLDADIIEIDPVKIGQYYTRSTGYNISRAEALADLFGEPVAWGDFIKALEDLPKTQEGVDVLELLKSVDATQAGRVRMNSEGSVFAYSLGQFASAGVNQTITPTIVATEGAATIVRSIMSPQLYSDFADTVKDFVKYLVDGNFAKLDGVEQEFERASGRVLVEFNDHLPQAVRESRIAQTAESLNTASRILGGERFATRAFRGLNFRLSYGRLGKYSNKLDRLAGLQRRFATAAEEIGAARAAGISRADLVQLRSAGLLDDRMLGIAKKIVAVDPKGLQSRERLTAVVAGFDSQADRALGSELNQRISQKALDDAESFVATPTATSRATASGSWSRYPVLKLMAGFTSWSMTFQNRTMTRLSTAAYDKQAGFLGMFLAAEIMNQMYRDVMYGGYSPEDAAQKWKDDPVKNTAVLLSRMPVWGPFNPATGLVQMFAAGYGGGLSSIADSPALSVMDRTIRSAVGVGEALSRGESPSESDTRTMDRVIPGWGLWYLQGSRRTVEGFNTDSDR